MNNRYICKAKRKDNGGWIYGDLIIDQYGKYYIHPNVNAFSVNEYNLAKCIQMIEVIPETIGQCTGLKDKNGKLIFEGDIIRTKEYGRVIAHYTVSDYDIFRITYVPAMFRIENIHRAFNLVGNSADYEVIGNIHDNPELLEVEK